jgi:uncharacterized membrane protein (UPF0127 family)
VPQSIICPGNYVPRTKTTNNSESDYQIEKRESHNHLSFTIALSTRAAGITTEAVAQIMQIIIRNETHALVSKLTASEAKTFFQRLRGLMFRSSLAPDEGMLFYNRRESIQEASIHMQFVFMNLGIVWANGNMVVVDKTLARPFEFDRRPSQSARYILEVHPSRLTEFEVGDQLSIDANEHQ